MYQRNLRITVFSKDTALETALRGVAPCVRFTHDITVYAEPDYNVLAESQLIIVEAEYAAALSDIRAHARAEALLCVRSAYGTAEDLPANIWSLVDDVWFGVEEDAVYFYFSKLLRGLAVEAEHFLSSQCLNAVIDSTPNLIWFKDARGAHLKVNEGFCRAVGKSKSEVEGRGHYFIWDLKKEEYEKGEFVCLETDVVVLESGKPGQFDEVVKCKNELRRFKTYKSPIFDVDGSVIGTVGVAHDITSLQNISAELEVLLQSMPFALVITDAVGSIVNANEKYLQALCVEKEQLLGQDFAAWCNSQSMMIVSGRVEGSAEVLLCRPEGDLIFDVYERDVLDIFGNSMGKIHIYKNVTVERELERRLSHYANSDSLTGLHNRRHFYENALAEYAGHTLGLLYLDLDNFKPVNDRYGHQAGDRALLLLANLLRIHAPGALIARLGGDEFVVLYSNCTLDALQRKAQELLEKMLEAFRGSEELAGLSASIGIVWTEGPAMTPDELIRRGDIAMYEAKRQGKTRCCTYSTDLEKTTTRTASPLSGTWRRHRR